ncbi:MAG TPA: helix-turn-helix transcriptional regulator [Acidimicrobiales bacterium]|nr:helix-turn-helix transcriptional regulator [Acidimicrobiales bacterium]
MTVPSYRLGQVAELAGVSIDTVRRWADAGRLPTTRTPGGRRQVAGADLARFLAEQAELPDAGVVVGQSARNRFPGIVTRVVKDRVAAQVEIRSGGHRIVSLLTAEAVEELGLEPGVLAVAAVKATSVVVEVTAR